MIWLTCTWQDFYISRMRQKRNAGNSGKVVRVGKMIRKSALAAAAMLFLLPVETGGAVDRPASNCGARNTVLDYLSAKFEEKPIAMGIAANGSLIEVLSSTKGTTFTIIVTAPDGKTCMVAAGEGWEDLIGRAKKPQI